MKVLAKIRKVIDVVLGSACALVFALMVCIGTYQIVKRLILNDPSTVSEELLTYSFTWMALLASAYVFGKRDHMRMGFLADKLTGTPRKILEIFIELLLMVFTGVVLIYGGISIMKLTMIQKTASLGSIPMGVIYSILPVTGVLIFIYSILNIIDLCVGKEQEHRDVKE